MSCTGCEHESYMFCLEVPWLDAVPDTAASPGHDLKVNTVNPGAVATPSAPDPYQTYELDPANPTNPWVLSKTGEDSQFLEVSLTRIYVDGWHGSCTQGDEGCEESTSCTYRIYLDLTITAVIYFDEGEKRPTPPTFPSLVLAAANSETVEGSGTSESPTGPTLNGTGTVVVEPAPTEWQNEDRPTTWASKRSFPYQAVWTLTPGCNGEDAVTAYRINLANFVIAASGYETLIAPEGEIWTLEPVVTCAECASSASPGQTTQGSGKNANPASITNQQ